MYSDERQSSRSPTTSRTDSYRDGPTSRINERGYQARSPIPEYNGTEDNEYEEASGDVDEPPRNERPPQRSEDQYIAALRYRFPNRPKSDYAYSKPVAPGIPAAPPVTSTTQRTTTTTTTTTPGGTTTTSSGGYQSSLRPTAGSTNTPDTSDSRTFPRPALRPVNPDQQNAYARRLAGETPTPASQSGPGITRPSVRINEPGGVTNRPTTTTTTNRGYGPSRTQESIFEKVHSQGGPVSYLGTGTFSQFEHCLRECLERERRQTGIASHIIRHDLPSSISAHDYAYDSVSAMPSPYNGLNPTTVHQFIDYPSRPTASYSIDDIRHINVALSRSGIPLFPYYPPYHDSYFSPVSLSHTYPSERHTTGEVVSACRLVEEDQAIISSRNGIQAVQNVWNAIQNHRSFSFGDHSRSSVSPRGLYDF